MRTILIEAAKASADGCQPLALDAEFVTEARQAILSLPKSVVGKGCERSVSSRSH
jgi:hypothetical protein